MTLNTNKALYVNKDIEFVIRDDIHTNDIAANELLIENCYSGVNPADIRHATELGIHSTVLGYDFTGRVVKAPTDCKFNEGDIVAGYTPVGIGRPLKYGTHQSHLAVPDDMVFKVPSSLPESHAAALTVVVMTAADVVHNIFKLPLPTASQDIVSPILIWGGSSGVGLSALQLARASGCKNILITASPGRHEYLKSIGATQVFDYASPTVVDDIVSAVTALDQGPLTHALDAAGTPSSSKLMTKCASQSTVLVSVIFRPGEKIQMPLAYTKTDVVVHPAGAPGPVTIPARPADHVRAWEVLQWVVNNYGAAFALPSVHVLHVTAKEALKEAFNVANGKKGFGKFVFKHPLR